MNDLPARDRDIAMVFQNYALYPHMTVRENMGFALKLAKVSKTEINTQGGRGRRHLGDAASPWISTGEPLWRAASTRCAGRAIVRDPKAFLMDEPLSQPRR